MFEPIFEALRITFILAADDPEAVAGPFLDGEAQGKTALEQRAQAFRVELWMEFLQKGVGSLGIQQTSQVG